MKWVTRILKVPGRLSKSTWFLAGWLIGGSLSGASARLDLAPADPTILWATLAVAVGIVVAWMIAWWLLVERKRPW